MARKKTSKKSKSKKTKAYKTALRFRDRDVAAEIRKDGVHIYARGAVCNTDARGYATPENRSPTELVVDASEGFIPLWDTDVTLRWRFQDQAMAIFVDPDAAKTYIRALFGEALLAWGQAAPVRFSERHDAWDFEITVRPEDDCDLNGCVLASAFFPDAGRHELVIYPKMFEQSLAEQVETMVHEIGHVFGLRHFFADIAETAWPVEIFGEHDEVTIMNYGEDSRLTEKDKTDLTLLYDLAWNGDLTEINGTPIKLVRPFSHSLHCDCGTPDLIAALRG